VVGVECREYEVASFGGAEGSLDRFEGAHFADKYHVGVLPEHVLERGEEAVCVPADLALIADAALGGVQIFAGVLDRDDVAGLRGGLAVAGWSGDEDEALALLRDLLDEIGETEIFPRGNLLGDRAQRGGHRLFLQIDVDTEAVLAPNRERQIEFLARLEFRL